VEFKDYYKVMGVARDATEAQIATLRTHLDYLRDKAAVWDARDRGDELAEAAAWERVRVVVERMEVAR